jgi:hypothetical protein
MRESGISLDTVEASAARPRGKAEGITIVGFVVAEWFDEHGRKYHESGQSNLITTAGDNFYVNRAAATTGVVAAATGMKLGTGSTAVAKSGAGAALVTYLTGSNKAFDATFPSVTTNVATYKRTYAPGEATSAGTNITEAVIVNDTIATDATSAAAATISRVLLASPAPKAAGDTLTVTWTHTITGA